MSWNGVLDDSQRDAFHRDGFLVIRAFYDVQADIAPIQLGIRRVIGQVLLRHGITNTCRTAADASFDDDYQALIAKDRSFGGEVYDAVKQIPAFTRLLGKPEHETLFALLRPGSIPGIAAGGSGIRIDNPGEDQYRAEWHQEYPSQLRSLDGLVFWSPLVEMTNELGPVRFCPGSHLAGPQPVHTHASGNGKTGAYAVRLRDEQQLLERYPQVAPLMSPGDLAVVDFLTLHASGYNTSRRSRWSMQFRYFNFAEPTGMSHGWKGSFAAGVDFRAIHPELCAD
ncbi:phytanoyl-CoA dioxygenase family protein [Lysobacter sp. Root494]|uniref:phytanoyl-CoA dioxygenase family protein n=1 Tax=Lysobacter sp. Root494 TaxID=1736549 RepID=UPI0006F9ABB8|nr:phytanoyl-CoA dioxygenase family protein [Lysobacter sp. Root494]KQY49726.1 phytanoyl-CoA dioxygenase [Lysobacter sp. Root494]